MAVVFRDWVAAVYASKLSAGARDTVIVYALHTTRSGTVRIPRDIVQQWTERGPRIIARHIAAATREGLITTVKHSGGGRPAVYRLTMPTDPHP